MANLKTKSIKHATPVETESKVRRVYFEDHGQDFMFWDIDASDHIIHAGPFQSMIWGGCRLSGGQTLEPGHQIEFWSPSANRYLRLNYPIEKVEFIDEEVSDAP